jgi:CYTH domain-containing protein
MTPETELGFRPLVTESNKFPPVKQIYNGYEIEKRFVVMTVEEDFTKNQNGKILYDEVLSKGTTIEQGYITDIQRAKEVLDELGIDLDFRPTTIRLRKFGTQHILTVKDRKETKKREVEWELDPKVFRKYWKETKGARVYKKRLEREVKGFTVEYDAFTDRFLLLAEIEVDSEKDLAKCPKISKMEVTGQKQWTNKTLSK